MKVVLIVSLLGALGGDEVSSDSKDFAAALLRASSVTEVRATLSESPKGRFNKDANMAPGGGATDLIAVSGQQESWPLSLAEAVRLGMTNAETVPIIPQEAEGRCGEDQDCEGCSSPKERTPLQLGRSSDIPLQPFRAELMAHLRSIEQLYWQLAYQQTRLWASEKAVRTVEKLLRKTRDAQGPGRRPEAEIVEIQQRLEQLRLDLVTATSDMISTERQFRNVVGLVVS